MPVLENVFFFPNQILHYLIAYTKATLTVADILQTFMTYIFY